MEIESQEATLEGKRGVMIETSSRSAHRRKVGGTSGRPWRPEGSSKLPAGDPPEERKMEKVPIFEMPDYQTLFRAKSFEFFLKNFA